MIPILTLLYLFASFTLFWCLLVMKIITFLQLVVFPKDLCIDFIFILFSCFYMGLMFLTSVLHAAWSEVAGNVAKDLQFYSWKCLLHQKHYKARLSQKQQAMLPQIYSFIAGNVDYAINITRHKKDSYKFYARIRTLQLLCSNCRMPCQFDINQ